MSACYGYFWTIEHNCTLCVTHHSFPPQKMNKIKWLKPKLGGKWSTPVQASAARKLDTLTQKLWLWLRQLGGGLSKHKWAVDKGGGGGGRLGGLLKYGGGGSCWEEGPRLNGIQYGTQPVTCKHGDRGGGKTTAYTMVWGFQRGDEGNSVFIFKATSVRNGRIIDVNDEQLGQESSGSLM